MATIKVVEVLDRASILLQDATNTRFPKFELLKFFNDAQREIVLHRPDANMVNENQNLVTGSKQSLPANGLRLIDIVRNQNGRSITQVDRKILDESLPNWHEATAGVNKIENYIYDGSDPKIIMYIQKPLVVHILLKLYIANHQLILLFQISQMTRKQSL